MYLAWWRFDQCGYTERPAVPAVDPSWREPSFTPVAALAGSLLILRLPSKRRHAEDTKFLGKDPSLSHVGAARGLSHALDMPDDVKGFHYFHLIASPVV